MEGDSIAKEQSYVHENLRLESIQSNSFVDESFIYNEDLKNIIRKIKPDIIVKGKEHQFRNNKELNILNDYGGKLIFSSGSSFYSSLELLNKEIKNQNYIIKPIEYFERHNINNNNLIKIVKNFKKLRIAILGDIIIDEYLSCESLGMSREEPVIVLKPYEKSKYLGGAGIVACHASNLGAEVDFFSVLGNDDESKFAIKKIKSNNINHHIIQDQGRVTTFKQRFRSGSKTMFKVSNLISDAISLEIQNKILNSFKKVLNKIDLIVFSDFNYGFLPQNLVNKILDMAYEKKIFISADSQSSSQFGDICRFKNVDLLTPTEHEARISTKNQDDGLVRLSELVRSQANAKHVLLKLGREGLLINSKQKNIQIVTDRIISLNKYPVDFAGAGDSMLIVSSMAQKN